VKGWAGIFPKPHIFGQNHHSFSMTGFGYKRADAF